MKTQSELLLGRIAAAAQGESYDVVKNATGNLLLNMLRQKHGTLAAAEEELDDLFMRMRQSLQQAHYSADGKTRKNQIMLPSMQDLLRSVH